MGALGGPQPQLMPVGGAMGVQQNMGFPQQNQQVPFNNF